MATDRQSLANYRPSWFWVGLFGIAFGFLEAIVVIYLRELYYPGGFSFPLVMATPELYLVELVRELSTLLILLAVGMLVGKSCIQRFAWFLFAFATWDIFYYIALKIFLDWPPSLLTWDVLFLIPIVWNAPVLAPVICSLTMIGFSIVVVEFQRKGFSVRLNRYEWMLMLVGALIIFITFIWDYTAILIRHGFLSGEPITEDSLLVQQLIQFVPSHFNWILFIPGEMLIIASIVMLWRRIRIRTPG